MKKFIALLLILATVLSLSGCATIASKILENKLDLSEEEGLLVEPAKPAQKEPDEAGSGEPEIKEAVLFDGNGFTLTATELTRNEFGDYELVFLLENNGDTPLNIQLDGVSVNGVMTFDIIYTSLQPGKKAYEKFGFYPGVLEELGIGDITDFGFLLSLKDDKYNSLVNNLHLQLITEGNSYTKPEISGKEIFNEEVIRLVYLGVEDNEYKFALENHYDFPISATIENLYVNDFAVSGLIYTTVSPDAVAIEPLTIWESELEDNRITEIEKLEFSIKITEKDNWEVLWEAEDIELIF